MYTRSSPGTRSMTARATVRPPKPESNMPMGRSAIVGSRYRDALLPESDAARYDLEGRQPVAVVRDPRIETGDPAVDAGVHLVEQVAAAFVVDGQDQPSVFDRRDQVETD